MSFVKGLIVWGTLLLLGGTLPGAAGAQSRSKPPAPTPVVDPGPSNVDLVNRALNPGPSNPDVPLPRQDLDSPGNPAAQVLTGPQIYGRQEQGGGVLGLRLPIPAERKL